MTFAVPPFCPFHYSDMFITMHQNTTANSSCVMTYAAIKADSNSEQEIKQTNLHYSLQAMCRQCVISGGINE